MELNASIVRMISCLIIRAEFVLDALKQLNLIKKQISAKKSFIQAIWEAH